MPKLDLSHLVDGQCSIQVFKRLPITSNGQSFELHSKVLRVYNKGRAGTVVKSQDSLVNVCTGEIYT